MKGHTMQAHLKNSLPNLLLPLLIFSSLITLSHSTCPPNDFKALLDIKNKLGPDSNFFFTWQPDTDCCKDWFAVQCDKRTGRVNYLAIGGNNLLVGPIPMAVGDLTGLKTLYFNDLPGLVEPIPESISKLSVLEDFKIARTNVAGPIPDFLSRLKRLKILDLSSNKFTGPIPGSLSQLRLLQQFDIQQNQLKGSIPSSFGTFKKVTFFQASNNLLSGPIPPSVGQARFKSIGLDNNRLTGDATFLFGKNKKTQSISLTNNALSFNFSKVEFPPTLVGLDVSHNMIYGSIPEQVAELPSLLVFRVSFNQLCGPIPKGDWVKKFMPHDFDHNKCLCGAPLAAC